MRKIIILGLCILLAGCTPYDGLLESKCLEYKGLVHKSIEQHNELIKLERQLYDDYDVSVSLINWTQESKEKINEYNKLCGSITGEI